MVNVDKERVILNVNLIQKYKDIIEEQLKQISEIKDDKEKEFQYLGVSMALFNILNKIIDLGEELIDSLDKNYVPIKYKEIIDVLEKEKVFSKKQAKIYRAFISYRNEIAHEYDEIEKVEIDWCIRHLNYIDEFIEIVKKRLL